MAYSPLFGGLGALGGLGQQNASAQSGWAQNTFTTTSNATSNTATLWIGEAGIARQAQCSALERVNESLPKTLRAELQAEVDAWLPKLTTI